MLAPLTSQLLGLSVAPVSQAPQTGGWRAGREGLLSRWPRFLTKVAGCVCVVWLVSSLVATVRIDVPFPTPCLQSTRVFGLFVC